MIYKELNKYDLQKEFKRWDRDQFTLEGYQVLIDLSQEMGDYELDVIAICCEYTEATEDEIRADYQINDDEDLLYYMKYKTHIVKLSNGDYLYHNYLGV